MKQDRFRARDCHAEVWTTIQGQLERFYTPDPQAKGFGVYGVFRFGDKKPNPIPAPPGSRNNTNALSAIGLSCLASIGYARAVLFAAFVSLSRKMMSAHAPAASITPL